MPLLLLAFVTIYCVALFPYAYFRHDDWLILGNAVLKLPQDWAHAFKPTLFYADFEVPWFYRPFLKLLGYGLFKLFGYEYHLWLGALLLVLVATIFLAARLVRLLSGDRVKGFLVGALFCGAIHFHFGSVLWVGEGIMNIPQIFLVTLNALLFFHVLLRPNRWSPVLFVGALLAYLLSLGFKESSVFHPVFLFAVLFCEPRLRSVPWKKKIAALTPYFFLNVAFLVYRLSMEMNPSYVAYWKWEMFAKPLAILGAAFLIVLVGYGQGLGIPAKEWMARGQQALRTRWAYFVFLGICIGPYLAHGFFSAGWLLLPGYYLCLMIPLSLGEIPHFWKPVRLYRVAGTVAVLSVVPVFLFLSRLGWFQWHIPQHEMRDILQTKADRDIQGIVVFDCANPRYPGAKFERVVAFEASLTFMWELFHQKKIPSHIIRTCEETTWREEFDRQGKMLYVRYVFPEITVLAGTNKVATTKR